MQHLLCSVSAVGSLIAVKCGHARQVFEESGVLFKWGGEGLDVLCVARRQGYCACCSGEYANA